MHQKSFCLNPDCLDPHNTPQDRFCVTCGSPTTIHGEKYSFFYGKYLVHNLLKTGRFGRDYAAIATDTPQRSCVIRKMMPRLTQATNTVDLRQYFDKEAQQLLRLQHAQLPRIYDYLSYDLQGKPAFYLIREQILGKTLHQVWQALGNFSPAQIQSIFIRLLPVLDYLHQNKIIHGNIQSSNIILQENTGKLILIGAGSRNISIKTTISGIGHATPLETALGKPKPASDLYSLAATCVRLMTGIFPTYDSWGNVVKDPLFDASHGVWQWRLHLQQQGVEVPTELGNILDNLLQPFAKDRYQSATEVLDILMRSKTAVSSSQSYTQASTQATAKSPTQSSKQQPIKQAKSSPSAGFFNRFKKSSNSEKPSPSTSQNKQLPRQTRPNSAAPTSISKSSQTSPSAQSIQGQNILPTEIIRRNFTENLGNNIYLEMIAIPIGSFKDNLGNIVKIQTPFYIGKYLVTQAQWQAVMGQNPSFSKNPLQPVECITWYDCQNFVKKLREKTGKNYRLPSETEWEYACRGVTSSTIPVTTYYFGDNPDLLTEHAWYDENSLKQTHPVGLKQPNSFGLYDMYGNVGEWCDDDWRLDYAGFRTQAVFTDKPNQDKVVRGGSWLFNQTDCCSAYRYWWSPQNWSHDLGLRVVCDVPRSL